MKSKLFISYCKEDKCHKDLAIAWSKNKKFDLSFKDNQTDFSNNSKGKKFIEACIKRDIKSCDAFVVILRKDTHKGKWIDFEIKTAHEQSKRIVGICTDKKYIMPLSLEKYADSICKEIKLEEIENIILGNKNKFSMPVKIELQARRCSKASKKMQCGMQLQKVSCELTIKCK